MTIHYISINFIQKNYYKNINEVFLKIKEGYNSQFNFLSLNSAKKESNFIKYCLKALNKELENLSLKNAPNFICEEEFKNFIDTKIKEIMKELSLQVKANDSKNISKIANTLKFIQNNITNISFYKNSNSKEFFDMLIFQIYNSDAYIEKEFYDYLVHSMEKFENFFRIPPEKRNTIAQTKFSELSKVIASDLMKLFESFNFGNEFESTKRDIEKYLNEQMVSAKQLLKENDNHISKSFSEIQEHINNTIKQLSSNLGDKLKYISKKFADIKEYTNKKEKEINAENNIKYNSLLEKINFDYENNFDGTYIKDKNDEFQYIIEIHGPKNKIRNFFKYLFKGKDKHMKDIISDLQNVIGPSLDEDKKSFLDNYTKMQKEIIDRITESFLNLSSNLSRINKEDFEKALKLFIETKYILLEEKSKEESIGNQKKERNKKKEEKEEKEEKEKKEIKNEKQTQIIDDRNKEKDYNNKKTNIGNSKSMGLSDVFVGFLIIITGGAFLIYKEILSIIFF